MNDCFVITCEHGGNKIPAQYRRLFLNSQALLDSHRGYDPGALLMAQRLSSAFDAPLVSSTVSRLLVDLNRSIGHAQHFSDATRSLPALVKSQILDKYYAPYRTQLEHIVRLAVADEKRVIHISSHSFTPTLNGKIRQADVGLLYDPARPTESELCARWKAAIATFSATVHVRRNYPYAGKGDGLASFLRQRFAPNEYVGIELEVNQSIVFAGGKPWAALRAMLTNTLRIASSEI